MEHFSHLTPQCMGLFSPFKEKGEKIPFKRGNNGLKGSIKIFFIQFYYRSLNRPKLKIQYELVK